MARIGEKQIFSTDRSMGPDSWSAWRQHMAEVYYRLDIQSRGDDALSGKLMKRSLLSTEVSWFSSDAQRVIRSRELAQGDHEDKYVFVSPFRGRFEYRQDGREGAAGAGQGYILRTNAYYQVDIAENSAMVALLLPSNIVEERFPIVKNLCAKECFGDPMLTHTIGQLINNSINMNSNISGQNAQNLLLGMLDLAIYCTENSKGNWKHADIAAEIVVNMLNDWIAAHLADPSIDASGAAAACGVSKRHLQKILEKRGSTFGRLLKEARLQKAATLLRAMLSPLQVGQIATVCGFRSQAHFATSYRLRFGVAPREEKLRLAD